MLTHAEQAIVAEVLEFQYYSPQGAIPVVCIACGRAREEGCNTVCRWRKLRLLLAENTPRHVV